jgi:hypothetical protein
MMPRAVTHLGTRLDGATTENTPVFLIIQQTPLMFLMVLATASSTGGSL